ncbi:MAG TPA: ABC transporter ATP-binding protein [Solirubrobacterales bacterium]|nr:ABC transporter ATP-binding protein [Solirubrobacterales bacterium]
MAEPVISIKGLRKSYGDTEAVRGIDLEVNRGEIFAFLGPNGAGKTTTVEILEGYRKRSGGEVAVLGEDPERAGREWRGRIGIVLQSCRLDPYLTARESLELYAGYYSNPRPVDEVIELVGLAGKADSRTGKLSGGQQRRLDVGMALVGDPELLFLDEPTTGFDPAARRQAWETIAGLRELGKTVFLTTHYMDEAQRLADRVAILSGGQVVARGAPEELGDRDTQPTVITYRGPDGEVSLTTTTPVETLNELTGRALAEGFALDGLEVKRPSLEDVYLELTEQPSNGAVEQEVAQP